MALTVRDRAVCWEKCRAAFQAHKDRARAAGTCLIYRLDDLGGLAEWQLAQGVCPYCRGPLTASNFAIGHKVPPTRAGKFSFRNLEVICRDCHAAKGVLDYQEFRELWILMRAWPKPVRGHFLGQLQRGARPATLPPVGSLEWFTGSTEPHALPEAVRCRRSPPIGGQGVASRPA
jgi:5-methylcytosine-specific restriction endonuclease McrA